jgi:hypothetical protein
MKIITAHQPNYLPWIGLFSKINQAKCFVVANTFELGGQSTFNRNKIRTNNGWGYLTVPIGRKVCGTRICEIEVPPDRSWKSNHWQNIYRNYSHTDYFKDYKDFFEDLYFRDFKYLWQINMEIILYLLKCFKIQVETLAASEMGLDSSLPTSDFLIALTARAGGDVYLSGPSGRDYLVLEKFTQQNMGLKFFSLTHPVYKQRYPGFEPNLSAIDLLFNMGPQAGELIKNSGSIVDQIPSYSKTESLPMLLRGSKQYSEKYT